MLGIVLSLTIGGSVKGSDVPSLLTNLQARATYYENVTCTTAILTSLETCP
tara:strand:- start:6 stop:158 length:153 start_codon:yes stop_codon:yes gene_type:complete